MKKVEILIESVKLNAVTEILEQTGVSGYTIFEAMRGKGMKVGFQDARGYSELYNVVSIVTVCPEDKARAIGQAMGPILELYGGIVYCTDAEILNT